MFISRFDGYPRLMRRLLLAAAVLLLAGCQSPRYDSLNLPQRYETGAQVRDALTQSGLGCRDFRSIPTDQRDIGDKDALESDVCRVGDTDVSIDIWQTLGQAQDWARSRQVIECQFARSLGSPSPVYVDGDRWTIALNARNVATEITKAIGGRTRFADCRSASAD